MPNLVFLNQVDNGIVDLFMPISRKRKKVSILVHDVLVKGQNEICNVTRFRVPKVGRRHTIEEIGIRMNALFLKYRPAE